MTNTDLISSERIEKSIYLNSCRKGDARSRSGIALRGWNEGA